MYSGVYDVQRKFGVVQFLPNEKIKIPLVWWVLLSNRDKTKGVSLIMHNYAYDYGELRPDPFCGRSYCNEAGLEFVIPQGNENHQALIYCCDAATITTRMPIYDNEELLTFEEKEFLRF